MQLFSNNQTIPRISHFDPHWWEALQMRTMQQLIYGAQLKEIAHNAIQARSLRQHIDFAQKKKSTKENQLDQLVVYSIKPFQRCKETASILHVCFFIFCLFVCLCLLFLFSFLLSITQNISLHHFTSSHFLHTLCLQASAGAKKVRKCSWMGGTPPLCRWSIPSSCFQLPPPPRKLLSKVTAAQPNQLAWRENSKMMIWTILNARIFSSHRFVENYENYLKFYLEHFQS